MENIENKILEKYNECICHINDIYEIFKCYYGEDNVDFDSNEALYSFIESIENVDDDESIIRIIKNKLNSVHFNFKIHWPCITISNELGNNITIHDLFCIVKINSCGGLGGIAFKRSTFSKMQLMCKYIHSHLQQINIPLYGNVEHCAEETLVSINSERNFCFGNGPINNTIRTLHNVRFPNNDIESIESLYMLLCRELDICVRIESLQGVPYIAMSNVKNKEKKYDYSAYEDITHRHDIISGFVKYLLKNNNFEFVYKNNIYNIASSFGDFAIFVTDKFFDYAKQFVNECDNKSYLLSYVKSCFIEVVKSNGALYLCSDNLNSDIKNVINKLTELDADIIKFKGTWYKLKIINTNEDEESSKMHVLTPSIISYIWDLITSIVNSNIELKVNTSKNESDSNKSICPDETVSKYGFKV